VICFSPHPDDDVISMGGTLIRLVEDGHEVHIAYMTSGNIAVFDHDAARVADIVTEYNRLFGIDQERSKLVEGTVLESLARKSPGTRPCGVTEGATEGLRCRVALRANPRHIVSAMYLFSALRFL